MSTAESTHAAGPVPATKTNRHHHALHEPGPASEPGQDSGSRRPWTVLALALTAQILVVLDISVVNTALPTIGRSLQLGSADLQWLVTAYLLLSGGGLLLGGRIADLLPRRRVFLVGLAVFTTASLFSGFAGGATELVAARAAQGLGAALMTPAALSIVMTTYAGAQRRKGLALWGAVGSLSVAGGVLLGGALTTWAGWQLIFWINVPIGVVALVVGLKVLPSDASRHPGLGQLDLPGALTAIGGLTTLMYGLGGAAEHGWISIRTLTALGLSALLLAAFVLVERRVPRPLIPPHTWKITTLVSGTTVMLGVTGILVATVFLTSIFLQTVLGFSALRAGIAFLPLALAITVGTRLAGRLLGHAAPRAVAAAGFVAAAAGAALLATASGSAHFASDLLPGLLILGLGVGMVFVTVSVTAMTGIPPQHAGMASGFLMTGHEIGAALGVAVLSAVAATAGSLTSPAGVAAGFSRGFVAAAGIAVLLGVLAFVRMPSARGIEGAAAHMH